MKKTLFALLALSGLAMGDTKATIYTSDADLKAYYNFNTSSNKTAGTIDFSEKPTWNEAGKYGESTTTTTHPYTDSAGLKAADGFTVSFDINNAGAGTLLSMTSGGMHQAWRTISMGIEEDAETSEKTLYAMFHGTVKKDNVDTYLINMTTTYAPQETEWNTLTLVGSVDPVTTSTLVLTFYVDGVCVGTGEAPNATNITGGNVISKMQFGYYGTSSKSASTNIDNILVFSRALDATEVAALQDPNATVGVPEPTTATLSLLALAGLAARRRRK